MNVSDMMRTVGHKPKEDLVTTGYPNTLFLVKNKNTGNVVWFRSETVDQRSVGHTLSDYIFR